MLVVHQDFTHTSPPPPATSEPWVDLKKLAKHLGFSYGTTAKLVREGAIPGRAFKRGKFTYWRFQLSVVYVAIHSDPGQ